MAWREIEGGKWTYRVSHRGEVQVLKNGSWLPLAVNLHENRATVKMRRKDGRRQEVAVALLVARAFIGPVEQGYCVRHKDRAKMNNHIDNLEIVPRGQANALCHGTRRRPVFKIDKYGRVLELYSTIKEAAEKNNFSRTAVLNRCRGRVRDPFRWADFSFRYEDNRK